MDLLKKTSRWTHSHPSYTNRAAMDLRRRIDSVIFAPADGSVLVRESTRAPVDNGCRREWIIGEECAVMGRNGDKRGERAGPGTISRVNTRGSTPSYDIQLQSGTKAFSVGPSRIMGPADWGIVPRATVADSSRAKHENVSPPAGRIEESLTMETPTGEAMEE